jgi:hypothetical protein
VFGLTVHEETGPFAQVRPAVGQHMRGYALGLVILGLAGGCLAALGLRTLLRRARGRG